MPSKTGLIRDEDRFIIDRLKNPTLTAEGPTLPPRVTGSVRVPLVSGLRVVKKSTFLGGTVFVLSWNEPNDFRYVDHYNVYIKGLYENNQAPVGPFAFPKSPAYIRLTADSAGIVTFSVQTVLKNGMNATLDECPTATAEISEPDVTVSDLGPGTAGQLITWDATGAPTTIGPGTNGQVVSSGGAGALPIYRDIVGVANETDVVVGPTTITVGIVDPLIVAKGGTGAATFTANAVLKGNGTGAILAQALGTANQVLGMNAGATDQEYKSLVGTANQVIVTHGVGSVTFSTPQNTHTGASPTFVGLTLSGLTQGSALFAGSGGSISQDNTNFFWDDTNDRLGIGVNSSLGARVHIAGSTTSHASLRLVSGTAPTSPGSGDVWHDSTQLCLQEFVAGIKQSLPGIIFTQTADVTIVNTVTETSLIGSGVGTVTLPANFFSVGKMIRFRMRGIYSDTVAPGTVTVRFKFGSTTLVAASAVTPPGSITNAQWEVELAVVCRTTGVAGTVMPNGVLEFGDGSGASKRYGMVATSAAIIDTTASQVIDLTWEWGTADAGNTTTAQVLAIEVLN